MASLPTSLPQLPTDVLRLVWDQPARPEARTRCLRSKLVGRARDQHALRCACEHLRDATTPFLSTLLIGFDYSDEQPIPSWQKTVRRALRQLSAFPPSATLTSLRWMYYERDADGFGFRPRVPLLLPGFFAAACERLASVEVVKLEGQLTLRGKHISCLVDACPRLRALTLEHRSLLDGALAPLTRLFGLRDLCIAADRLANSTRVESAAALYQCLTSISTLTSLNAHLPYHAEDVLPHLLGLPSLLRLSMSIYRRDTDSDAVLHCFSCLTTLTALTLCFCDDGNIVVSSGLALPPQLARLDLDDVTLDSAAIRLVCSLPRLRELSVGQLEPDCDLSGIACGFTQLSLQRCRSPLQVTHLPLANVQRLSIGWIDWTLDANAVPEVTCDILCQACLDVLASKLDTGNTALPSTAPRVSRFCLCWNDVPPLAASVPCLLAALVPLARLLHFFQHRTLVFGENWDVSSEHVEQLAAHLPSLHALWVADAQRPNFVRFATAVGSKLPSLRALMVGNAETGPLPQASQDALLALASIRAANGPPMAVEVCGHGMSALQLQHCNTVVRLIRRTVGKTRLNKAGFSAPL